MAAKDHILFDTAPFGTSAGTTHSLFQVTEGGDGTHTKDFTNSPGAGSLPNKQKMTVNSIEVWPEADILEEENQKVWNKSYLRVEVDGDEKLRAPLLMFAAEHAQVGEFHEATNSKINSLSWTKKPMLFKNPIIIPGGTPFKIEVYQSVATAGTEQVKVALVGLIETAE